MSHWNILIMFCSLLDMYKIMVSAFEPFGRRRRNISQEVLEYWRSNYTSATDSSVDLHTRVLPVAYSKMEDLYKELVDGGFDCIILCGEFRRSSFVQVERIALNVAHSTFKDNLGHQAVLEEIIPGEPLALKTSLSTRAIVNRIRRRGVSARISHGAGTFLCNAAYYLALRNQPNSVFLHFPGKMKVKSSSSKAKIVKLADSLDCTYLYLLELAACQ